MATDFNPGDYFNLRLMQELDREAEQGISSKWDQVQKASAEKLSALEALRQQSLKIREQQENSFVSRMGLDPNSNVGSIANMGVATAAELASGVSTIATLPHRAALAGLRSKIPQAARDALTRETQGRATPADLEALDKPFANGRTNRQRLADEARTSQQKGSIEQALSLDEQVAPRLDTWERQSGLIRRGIGDRLVDLAEGVVSAGEAAVGIGSAVTGGL